MIILLEIVEVNAVGKYFKVVLDVAVLFLFKLPIGHATVA